MQLRAERGADGGGNVFPTPIGLLMFVLVGMPAVAYGQAAPGNKPAPAADVYLGAKQLRFEHHFRIAEALGPRVAGAGLERMIVLGTLTRGKESIALRIVRELPALYRIEEAKAGGRLIASFDGLAGKVPGADSKADDEDLAESLAHDSAETFLYAVAQNAPYRFIGGRFRTDDGKAKDYAGPYLDIFQVEVSVEGRTAKDRRQKMFMFDSVDYLLRRVVYEVPLGGKQSRRIEVFLDGWRTLNGQRVAGTVTRKVDGVEQWSFQIMEAATGPKQNDGIF